jgi:hypothetical protein
MRNMRRSSKASPNSQPTFEDQNPISHAFEKNKALEILENNL